MQNNPAVVSIVGVGEDGWEGLAAAARDVIEAAEVIVGSARHLALVPPTRAEHITWPSPMLPFVDRILEQRFWRNIVVLASGDPMLCGVGAVFARRIDAAELQVIPHVSSFALACARLGWPSSETTLISMVNRPLERLHPHVQPGRRLIVFAQDGSTPRQVAELLVERGYGPSSMCVFEHLGGAREQRREAIAQAWEADRCADLNLVAVLCKAHEGTRALAVVPGLPDDVYESDGQLTKREVRAATLARLVPLPGALLWDVGAGMGSIGIEWMRTHPTCRAVAFERHAARTQSIVQNARRLGVPGLRVIAGSAPASFANMEAPDAIFIGGGIAADDLVAAGWAALSRGGRLVANVVTVEGEATLAALQASFGGELVRFSIARAEPVGALLGWRPMMPVTQWAITKS